MRFSAVVPTGDSGRTIAACLESRRNQTHDEGQISLLAQYKEQYYGRWVAECLAPTKDARGHEARPAVLAHPGPLLRDEVHAGGMLTLKAVEAAGLVRRMVRARRSGQLGVGVPNYGRLSPAAPGAAGDGRA